MNSSSFIWGNFIVFLVGIFVVCLGTARLTAKIIQDKPNKREKFILLNGSFILSCLLVIHLAYDPPERIQAEGMIGMLTLYALFTCIWVVFSKGER
jgi:integral membrane sensor domain MASE1